MSATLLLPTLKKFKDRVQAEVFIETGSYDGRGIEFALMAGFREVHSIEIDPRRYTDCAVKYMPFMDVHVYFGDTLKLLGPLLERVQRRAVIWLDAHPIGAGDNCPRGLAEWPLMGELAILKHRSLRHDHTLLIDDRDCFSKLFGTTDDLVEKAIREIDPRYQFTLEPNTMMPNDILAAEIVA